MCVAQADGEEHQHDSTVTSVSIQQAGELHPERLNTWLQVGMRLRTRR